MMNSKVDSWHRKGTVTVKLSLDDIYWLVFFHFCRDEIASLVLELMQIGQLGPDGKSVLEVCQKYIEEAGLFKEITHGS